MFGFVVLGLTLLAAPARAEDEPTLAEYFGFQPLEIYKLETRISGLLLRDLDGDKVDDILVINNARSRIDLLLSSESAPAEPPSKPEANQVRYDRRMTLRSVPVNKEIVSLQVGDMNGDGRPDLVFYGNPSELIVLYNSGKAHFEQSRRIAVGEAVTSGTALAVGDLNRDGRDDLALLGAEEVTFVLQGQDGNLGDPERLPHTAVKPGVLKLVDLDGDGGDDLAILDASGDDPLRVRFSTASGDLGPEERFALESPRALTFADLDGKPGLEVLTIDAQSGRARASTLDSSGEDESATPGRLIVFPLPKGNARERTLDVGDLDGDGRAEVVVTDPNGTQIFVSLQKPEVGLGMPRSFPGLIGGKTVKLADVDGDGKAEVYILSEKEKQIGRSVLADGRLTFPTPLPITGEPLALEAVDLSGDGRPELLYVVKSLKPGGGEAFALRGLKWDKGGSLIPLRWAGQDAIIIDGLNAAPTALKAADVNRDGQPDLIAFTFGAPILLLGRPDGEPYRVAPGLGPLAGITSPAALTATDLDGPALFLAQNTFARDLLLGPDEQWKVRDQYDSRRGSAQVVGATTIDLDGDGVKEIVLMDRSSKSLLLLSKRPGDMTYRPTGTISIGAIDFQGFHVADFDSDGRPDLLVAGVDRFGVVLAGRRPRRLKTLASYESHRKEAVLSDLVAADLNNDGRPDIALTDTAEHFVEIITATGPRDLSRGLAFKVYERKSMRDIDSLVEPRDIAVGDVDGDGRTDLVLIVHDRVLVYRQDPGTKVEVGRKK